MAELLLALAPLAAYWLYRQSKIAKYPQRLGELEAALRTQADLWLHRNKSPAESARVAAFANALERARTLLNDDAAAVAAHWGRLRPSVMELSSDAGLKHADLHFSDRAQDIREAIFHLVRRLDKIEATASRGASGS